MCLKATNQGCKSGQEVNQEVFVIQTYVFTLLQICGWRDESLLGQRNSSILIEFMRSKRNPISFGNQEYTLFKQPIIYKIK